MIWLASTAAVTVALPWVALLRWLVRREEARWQRFRKAHGEPEVFAAKIAAKADRSQLLLIGLMVVGSTVGHWQPEAASPQTVPPAITA